MAGCAEGEGFVPDHLIQLQGTVKMREKLATARGFPFQGRAKAVCIKGNQHQIAFAGTAVGKDAVRDGKKQYIIASHSPIMLGCPGAQILSFDYGSIQTVDYTATTSYTFYKDFIADPSRYFKTSSP